MYANFKISVEKQYNMEVNTVRNIGRRKQMIKFKVNLIDLERVVKSVKKRYR